MIYRRDTRNRSLDDFSEARPRATVRAGRRNECAAHPEGAGPLKAKPPALAAAPALK